MSKQRYTFRDQSFHGKYAGDPNATGSVELVVDWDKLVKALGRKAALNKTRTSRLSGLGIVARFYPEA